MVKIKIPAIAFLLASCTIAVSQPRTGSGRAEFFDSTAYSDGFRVSMTGVSMPSPGKAFIAWLVADDDLQYLKLGELTVDGSGDVSFAYKDNGDNNLLAGNKKFLISEETVPFSGLAPTNGSVVFADSLNGPGSPTPGSPLARIRNCLVSFTNTAQNLGLAIWFKKHIKDYTDHAGFARDGMQGNNTGEANVHADHIVDFIKGMLSGSVSGNTSVAANGDPVGYGYRRYGDMGTNDSSQGGAGFLGGAGYQVSMAVAEPSANLQMKKAGARALLALNNAFGSANDSGFARELTDRSLNIINGVYQSGSLAGEAGPFHGLAMRFINGEVGATDTGASTGGILQAYYHMQQMATFILDAPQQPVSVERDTKDIPVLFELMQNYPNPFNGMTTIPFRLKSAARVRLTVFNLLGQEVVRLVDARLLGAGEHSVTWDSGAAGSGTYVYELLIDMPDSKSSNREIRHMILVK